MLKNKSSIRNIFVFSILGILLFVAYLVELSSRINALQSNWSTNNQIWLDQTRSIEWMLSELGYVGYIHHFKNFVLRKDSKYLLLMEENIVDFNYHLNRLEKLLKDENSVRQIQILRTTIAEYQNKTSIFELETTLSLRAEELDKFVRVDDTAAEAALHALMDNIEKSNLAIKNQNDQYLRKTLTFLSYGVFVVIAILVLLATLIASLRSMHRTNASLSEAVNRIDALIDASPEAMLIIDKNGVITRINDNALQVFKAEKNQLVGHTVESFIPENFRHNHHKLRQNFVDSGGKVAMADRQDLSALKADGSEFAAQISLNRTDIDDQPAVIMNIRDVTKQRAIEQAAEQKTKLEALGQLTAGVAHDFNNILTTIGGNNDLVRKHLNPESDSVISYLQSIASSVKRATALNSRLLSFGRKQTLLIDIYSVEEILEDLTQALARALGERFTIDLALSKDLWPISTDKAQLESAILNLCLNAKHAMPDGGKITISAENKALHHDLTDEFGEAINGDYVLLKIVDKGIGMQAEIQQKIFEPFFTTKHMGEGSGLGLSMVYGFIRQSKGHIKIFSEEGKGTSVELYLPAMLDNPVKTVSTDNLQDDYDLDYPVSVGQKILVIEDDEFVRAIPVELLKDKGFELLEASSPSTALAIAKSTPQIDLIFSDIVLSDEKNGVELFDELTQYHPQAKVIFTSGYARNDIIRDIKLDETQEFLAKPYSAKELYEVVGRVLSNDKD